MRSVWWLMVAAWTLRNSEGEAGSAWEKKQGQPYFIEESDWLSHTLGQVVLTK